MKRDWLDAIPSSWKRQKLKHVVHLMTERAESRPEGAPYVGLENIESHTGRLIQAQHEQDDREPDGTSTVNLFQRGDLLFGKLRPYLAKGWLCEFDGACTTEALVLRPATSIESAYLLRVLLSQDFIRAVDTTTFGSKMPRADWDSIGNLEVPVPSLKEQKEIVAVLSEQALSLDQLIAGKRQLLELLSEKRSVLITHAVTRGLNPDALVRGSGISWLGNIPAHWKTSRVAWLFDERDERNQPDLPLLEVSIHGGVRLREFSDERIEQVAEDFNSYKVARSGDISFNKMRMWQGAVGKVPCDGLVSPDYVVARPNAKLNSEYFGLLFRASAFSAEAGSRSHGIVWDRLRLYWEEFRDISVPVPPLDEQERIVAYVQVETQKVDELIAASAATVYLLEERRSALISAAVSGTMDWRQSDAH